MPEVLSVTLEMVRNAVQALGTGGHEVSYRQVYEALGLTNDAQQAVVRTRVSGMAKHGEITRTGTGRFVYNFNRRPRDAKVYAAMWRFVRASKPGWSVSECGMRPAQLHPCPALCGLAGGRRLCGAHGPQ